MRHGVHTAYRAADRGYRDARDRTHGSRGGRADTSAGGSNLAFARRSFAQGVQITVKRKDQRAIIGDGKIVVINLDALPFEFFDLVSQCPWIQHNAISDHAHRARDYA